MQPTRYKSAPSVDYSEKTFDLEERTLQFALMIRRFAKQLPRTSFNLGDIRQLIRASGAIGANYLEANDSLGSKDFLMRVKIARKEAKESIYWLKLIEAELDDSRQNECAKLSAEAVELVKILSAIARKFEHGVGR